MPDWDEILQRDGPAAWRAAYRLLGNRDDADECFQEAVLAALEVSRRGAVGSWRALLVRLAAARAVDRLREQGRRQAREARVARTMPRDPAPTPARSAEQSELADQLREALGRIPPKQAEVFVLIALEGWSYAEAADHLGASTDAVGVLLHRARGRLRRLLAAFEATPATGPTRPRKEPS